MQAILLEAQINGVWQRLGPLVTEYMPLGSMSSEEPDGRQVYVFGWRQPDGPCVWRSVAGIDIEAGVGRLVTTAGLDLVARLEDVDEYTTMWCRGNDIVVPIRFSLTSQ